MCDKPCRTNTSFYNTSYQYAGSPLYPGIMDDICPFLIHLKPFSARVAGRNTTQPYDSSALAILMKKPGASLHTLLYIGFRQGHYDHKTTNTNVIKITHFCNNTFILNQYLCQQMQSSWHTVCGAMIGNTYSTFKIIC